MIFVRRTIEMTLETTRNIGLDILKCFCIPFIILLHTGVLKYSFSINLEPISRFAVPCFFIITGFFYNDIVKRGKEKKQIKKIIFLIIVFNVLIISLNAIYFKGNGVVNWIISCFSKTKVIDFLVFNEALITGHFGSSHIWYLNALLYVLFIAFAYRKLKIFKLLYYFTPIFLICGFILECFSKQLFGVNFSDGGKYYYYRNFITVGIPYFCIGNLLRSFKLYEQKFKNAVLLVLSLFLLMLSFVEFRIEKHFGLTTNGEFFILTPFYSTGIFLFFHNVFERREPNKAGKIAALIGEKYVIWIYLFHLPVIVIIIDVLLFFGVLVPDRLLVSLLTLAVSLFVAVIIDYVLKLRKRNKRII